MILVVVYSTNSYYSYNNCIIIVDNIIIIVPVRPSAARAPARENLSESLFCSLSPSPSLSLSLSLTYWCGVWLRSTLCRGEVLHFMF